MKNWTIVFDLDGTLIDTVPDVCGALNRTLEKIDRRPHTVDEVKDYMGRGAAVTMERALGMTGEVPSAEIIERLTKEFLQEYADNPVNESKVYPHVYDTLLQLREEQAILAICTNKPSITAFPVLKAFDMEKHFNAIICGDQTRNCKPSGDHIQETIVKAKGHITSAIMVGDSENDIDAAIDLGVPSVAVTFGYTHTPCHKLGATVLVDDFGDLVDALRDIADR